MLILLFVLLTSGLDGGESQRPRQRIVGKLVAPVTYSFIHYYRSPEDLGKMVAAVEDNFDRAMDSRLLSLFWMKKLTPFRERMGNRTMTQKKKIGNLMENMNRAENWNPTGHRREKRSLSLGAVLFGVAGLGLGVANRIEMEHMKKDITQGETELHDFIMRTNDNFRQVEKFLVHFNETVRVAIQQENSWVKMMSRVDKMKIAATMALDQVDDKIAHWERSVYEAMRGTLDSGLVDSDALEQGLQMLQDDVRGKGLEVIDMSNKREALFALPLITYCNGTGLHVMLAAPMKPIKAPIFNLVRMNQAPIPLDGGKMFLKLKLDDIFLAVDEDKTLSAEISATELVECREYKLNFLCDRRAFDKEPNTCTAALLFGNDEMASKLCRKTVSLNGFEILSHTQNTTTIWSAKQTTVKKVCLGKEAPLIRVNGTTTVAMENGCFIDSDVTRTFFAQGFELEEIDIARADWDVPHLLEDIDVDDLHEVMKEFDEHGSGGKLELDLHVARDRIAERKVHTSLFRVGAYATIVITIIIGLALLLRYAWLACEARKRQNRKRSQREEKIQRKNLEDQEKK